MAIYNPHALGLSSLIDQHAHRFILSTSFTYWLLGRNCLPGLIDQIVMAQPRPSHLLRYVSGAAKWQRYNGQKGLQASWKFGVGGFTSEITTIIVNKKGGVEQQVRDTPSTFVAHWSLSEMLESTPRNGIMILDRQTIKWHWVIVFWKKCSRDSQTFGHGVLPEKERLKSKAPCIHGDPNLRMPYPTHFQDFAAFLRWRNQREARCLGGGLLFQHVAAQLSVLFKPSSEFSDSRVVSWWLGRGSFETSH